MANKTCGDCKFYCDDAAFCSHYGVGWKKKSDMVCKDFEPIPKPTNGDKIKVMGNEELITCLGCTACIYAEYDCTSCDCAEGRLEWLNAPAESEGGDE